MAALLMDIISKQKVTDYTSESEWYGEKAECHTLCTKKQTMTLADTNK